ncbi:MAG: CppA family protein [Streptococcaceae bacterium]|nr:CppA family protein [Streptococcaceae bacterium]
MEMKADNILPVYRINNREINLNFFKNVLGMKVHLEEGAMVELGGHQNQEARVLLEESPAKVKYASAGSVKKHARTVIFANADEVNKLSRNNISNKKVEFLGNEGFSALSPEGDEFWLIASDFFQKCDSLNTGLSDFLVSELKLNVASLTTARRDFEIFNEISTVFKLTFNEQVPNALQNTWDIEAILVQLPESSDLKELYDRFSGYEPYLDKEQKLLSVYLPEGLEIWFEKHY